MKPNIIWEPWRDPMVPADLYDEVYPPDDDEDDEEYASVRRQFSDGEKPRFSPYRGLYLYGPHGITPLHNHNLAGKLYKLWFADTNFDVTPEHRRILDEVPGVEVFKAFSRYRFWLGVGRLFDDSVVKEAVEAALYKSLAPTKTDKKPADAVSILCRYASRQYPHWAIVRRPDGQLCCVGDKELSKAQTKVGEATIMASSWGKVHEEGGA